MEQKIEDDDKIEIKWRDWFRRPIWAYKSSIKNSVIPLTYSHQVKMDIPIKAGERSGTALIPCTIYAMDHSIDLNPALIKKKTKKQVAYLDPKLKYRFLADERVQEPYYQVNNDDKIVRYNPIHLKLELTEEEQLKGYRLNEIAFSSFERCDKCDQKLVIAEVQQTRYRSCPSINVKLADPARQDTIVPVQFGFDKSDVIATYWTFPIMMFGAVALIGLAWGIDMFTPLSDLITKPITWGLAPVTSSAVASSWTVLTLQIIITAFFVIFFIPTRMYKAISILKWYHSVKKYVSKNEKPESN